PVYIFYGQSDRVVKPSISESLIGFYQTLVAPYNIRITAIPEAGHAFPTLSSDNDCGDPDANHLQNCHFDGAGEALRCNTGYHQFGVDIVFNFLGYFVRCHWSFSP
ncbi:hypothetical protein, partial [Oceanospirillum sediminis]|uniref:hypothetical protein n=1 Tax=Oceanospirillum sediminis TaxID=2760088 RepID=UPI001C71AD6E